MEFAFWYFVGRTESLDFGRWMAKEEGMTFIVDVSGTKWAVITWSEEQGVPWE